MPRILRTEAIKKTARLLRRVRKAALAWDVEFFGEPGDSITIAVVGTEREIMSWARMRANAKRVKKWASRPFPEFNDRYAGRFAIAGCPSWVLVRPDSGKLKKFMEGTL